MDYTGTLTPSMEQKLLDFISEECSKAKKFRPKEARKLLSDLLAITEFDKAKVTNTLNSLPPKKSIKDVDLLNAIKDAPPFREGKPKKKESKSKKKESRKKGELQRAKTMNEDSKSKRSHSIRRGNTSSSHDKENWVHRAFKKAEKTNFSHIEFLLRVRECEGKIQNTLKKADFIEALSQLIETVKLDLTQEQYVNIVTDFKQWDKNKPSFRDFMNKVNDWYLKNKPAFSRLDPIDSLNTQSYLLLTLTFLKDYLKVQDCFAQNKSSSNTVNKKLEFLSGQIHPLFEAIESNKTLDSVGVTEKSLAKELSSIINVLSKLGSAYKQNADIQRFVSESLKFYESEAKIFGRKSKKSEKSENKKEREKEKDREKSSSKKPKKAKNEKTPRRSKSVVTDTKKIERKRSKSPHVREKPVKKQVQIIDPKQQEPPQKADSYKKLQESLKMIHKSLESNQDFQMEALTLAVLEGRNELLKTWKDSDPLFASEKQSSLNSYTDFTLNKVNTELMYIMRLRDAEKEVKKGGTIDNAIMEINTVKRQLIKHWFSPTNQEVSSRQNTPKFPEDQPKPKLEVTASETKPMLSQTSIAVGVAPLKKNEPIPSVREIDHETVFVNTKPQQESLLASSSRDNIAIQNKLREQMKYSDPHLSPQFVHPEQMMGQILNPFPSQIPVQYALPAQYSVPLQYPNQPPMQYPMQYPPQGPYRYSAVDHYGYKPMEEPNLTQRAQLPDDYDYYLYPKDDRNYSNRHYMPNRRVDSDYRRSENTLSSIREDSQYYAGDKHSYDSRRKPIPEPIPEDTWLDESRDSMSPIKIEVVNDYEEYAKIKQSKKGKYTSESLDNLRNNQRRTTNIKIVDESSEEDSSSEDNDESDIEIRVISSDDSQEEAHKKRFISNFPMNHEYSHRKEDNSESSSSEDESSFIKDNSELLISNKSVEQDNETSHIPNKSELVKIEDSLEIPNRSAQKNSSEVLAEDGKYTEIPSHNEQIKPNPALHSEITGYSTIPSKERTEQTDLASESENVSSSNSRQTKISLKSKDQTELSSKPDQTESVSTSKMAKITKMATEPLKEHAGISEDSQDSNRSEESSDIEEYIKDLDDSSDESHNLQITNEPSSISKLEKHQKSQDSSIKHESKDGMKKNEYNDSSVYNDEAKDLIESSNQIHEQKSGVSTGNDQSKKKIVNYYYGGPNTSKETSNPTVQSEISESKCIQKPMENSAKEYTSTGSHDIESTPAISKTDTKHEEKSRSNFSKTDKDESEKQNHVDASGIKSSFNLSSITPISSHRQKEDQQTINELFQENPTNQNFKSELKNESLRQKYLEMVGPKTDLLSSESKNEKTYEETPDSSKKTKVLFKLNLDLKKKEFSKPKNSLQKNSNTEEFKEEIPAKSKLTLENKEHSKTSEKKNAYAESPNSNESNSRMEPSFTNKQEMPQKKSYKNTDTANKSPERSKLKESSKKNSSTNLERNFDAEPLEEKKAFTVHKEKSKGSPHTKQRETDLPLIKEDISEENPRQVSDVKTPLSSRQPINTSSRKGSQEISFHEEISEISGKSFLQVVEKTSTNEINLSTLLQLDESLQQKDSKPASSGSQAQPKKHKNAPQKHIILKSPNFRGVLNSPDPRDLNPIDKHYLNSINRVEQKRKSSKKLDLKMKSYNASPFINSLSGAYEAGVKTPDESKKLQNFSDYSDKYHKEKASSKLMKLLKNTEQNASMNRSKSIERNSKQDKDLWQHTSPPVSRMLPKSNNSPIPFKQDFPQPINTKKSMRPKLNNIASSPQVSAKSHFQQKLPGIFQKFSEPLKKSFSEPKNLDKTFEKLRILEESLQKEDLTEEVVSYLTALLDEYHSFRYEQSTKKQETSEIDAAIGMIEEQLRLVRNKLNQKYIQFLSSQFEKYTGKKKMMNQAEFLRFCEDFSIMKSKFASDNSKIPKKVLDDIFDQISDLNRELNLEMFKLCLKSVSDFYFGIEYDILHSTDYQKLPPSKKLGLLCEKIIDAESPRGLRMNEKLLPIGSPNSPVINLGMGDISKGAQALLSPRKDRVSK